MHIYIENMEHQDILSEEINKDSLGEVSYSMTVDSRLSNIYILKCIELLSYKGYISEKAFNYVCEIWIL